MSATLSGRRGFVSLVGAGPGDPELLTRQAVRRLRQADVVVYDALVQPEVLAFARRATRVFVGKRAGGLAADQSFINAFLVRSARRGQRVVRLKGGDPFVFGRGGEEALALTAAGIPFDIVPGVSSSIAAAGLAGIPLTHRGRASAFVVVSGHARAAYKPVLEGIPPNAVTVVVMMGLVGIHDIAGLLLSRGWRRETPVAMLLAASTPAAETRITSLEWLAAAGPPETEGKPGTIVIGDVVAVRTAQNRGTDDQHSDAANDRTQPRVVCERSGHR